MKTYIALVYDEANNEKYHYVINENDLQKWLKNESLKNGDEVYEVVLYGRVSRKTEIIYENKA